MSTAALQIREHFNLPTLWDGHKVEWEDELTELNIFICPPPKKTKVCEGCGTSRKPLLRRGLRYPLPGEMFESTREKVGRWGSLLQVPTRTPAWPVYDLFAFRCSDCPHDEV